MPPGVVRCKYFTASPACGAWATSALWESSCNILFVCHISKLPATWEGNNRVQPTCLCPLSFLTHEAPPHHQLHITPTPPMSASAPDVKNVWRNKGKGGVTWMTSAERGWSWGHSCLFEHGDLSSRREALAWCSQAPGYEHTKNN